MWDILLLVMVAATFIYGYFAMGWLVRFLEKLQSAEDHPAETHPPITQRAL